MSNKIKIIYICLFFFSAATIIAILPKIGLSSTLQGQFYYSSEYVHHLFTKASNETLTMFLWMEIFDLFVLIPLYTFMIYQLLKIVMYNFDKSPFKVFAFAPAFFDIPETVILILNNALYSYDPILYKLLPILSFFKWTIGGCLLVLVIIFSFAKTRGVTGMVKIMSYEELCSNKENIKTYWKWIIGHVLITIVSVLALIIMMSLGKVPYIILSNVVIGLGTAVIYDFVFNKFLPIPREIFNEKYNLWLRAVFISFNSIFLLLAVSVL